MDETAEKPSETERAQIRRDLEDAQREVDAAVAVAGDSPELRDALQQIKGAQASAEMTRMQIDQARGIADQAKEKAREEEGKEIAKKTGDMVLSVAALGAVLEAGRALFRGGASLTGGDIPKEALATADMGSNLTRADAPTPPVIDMKIER